MVRLRAILVAVLPSQNSENDWQHRRSCRTWSAVRTTKLCILIYVAPPFVVHLIM